jgi:1-acyl-sn-glycerol-3-phosphate acyltransferase
VAYLASRANVPVIPVSIEGTKGFPALRFTSPWHGQGARVRFGHPFRYLPKYRQAGREELGKMTDEAMYVLAEMLPIEQRGYYSNLANATQETLFRSFRKLLLLESLRAFSNGSCGSFLLPSLFMPLSDGSGLTNR